MPHSVLRQLRSLLLHVRWHCRLRWHSHCALARAELTRLVTVAEPLPPLRSSGHLGAPCFSWALGAAPLKQQQRCFTPRPEPAQPRRPVGRGANSITINGRGRGVRLGAGGMVQRGCTAKRGCRAAAAAGEQGQSGREVAGRSGSRGPGCRGVAPGQWQPAGGSPGATRKQRHGSGAAAATGAAISRGAQPVAHLEEGCGWAMGWEEGGE